ncbi:MAG TPA: TetR/AcrR family transcriptional regulator [Ktedonobacteraceae bacterium]|nr:TetR/AcrR family transcriptional regulator [Ktedonobacteraceae bacterium]
MEQTEMGMVPRCSLKEKQRQEREALILQMAEEVLMEKGYYEASIDEIASRVGIAKGTVYLHFPSKEDLVVAILRRDIQQLLAKVDEVAGMDISSRDKVVAILRCMYGNIFVKRMQLLYSLYNSGEAKRHWKEHGETLGGLWEQLATRMSNLLEQGKVAGEFSASIPTPIMLCAFFSLLSPKSYERLMVEGKVTGDELVTYLEHIYFKGITNS